MTAEIIKIPNYSDVNITDDWVLNAISLISQPIATFLSSEGVVVNDWHAFNPGGATGEILQVASISGQNVTYTTNFGIQHNKNERIVKLFGNKVNVYKATNIDGNIPLDTAFTLVASIFLDPDAMFTGYTDNTGGSNYWYKFTYLNSTSAAETGLDLAFAMRGGGYGHYVSLEDIKKEAGVMDAKRLDDTQVEARRSEAESEIKGKLSAAGYSMPLQTGTGVSYTPPIIENIARLLAAGLIQMQDYGVTKPGGSKDGSEKMKEARAMLAEIQLRDTMLLDSNDQILGMSQLVTGWPNETTATIGTDGVTPEPSVFTMSKVF